MILTGEAAKFAEKFEALNNELVKEHPILKERDENDLDELEQILLYTLTRMFTLDENFRKVITHCMLLYAERMTRSDK